MTRTHTRLLFILIGIGVISVVFTSWLRRTSPFSNFLELPLYDHITQLTWPWKVGHPDVVVVTIQDAKDWPLSDGKLASVLEKLSSTEPKVIAIDLIRDSYRSPTAESAKREAERLDTAFGWNGSLLTIQGLHGPGHPGFAAPPYFLENGEEAQKLQVGLANFPRDQAIGHTIRRGLFKTSSPDRFGLPALAAIHAASKMELKKSVTSELMDSLTKLTPNAGGYALKEESFGSQFLLKFGPKLDNLFPEYSMHEVLETMSETELEEAFSGKVIFFGTGNRDTAQDELAVIGNAELRGVKLLALTTAQLLRELTEGEKSIRTTSENIELSLISISGLLTTMVMWFFRMNGTRRVLSLFLITGFFYGIGIWALKTGLWVPMAAPIFTAVIISGVSAISLYQHTVGTLKNYSATLRQQFGDSVATLIEDNKEELLKDGSLPSHQFEGSAFFSDLVGFTGITEKFALEKREDEFLAWINRYISAMIPVVKKHGGVIVKFAGDGIFIIFGFGKTHQEDHAEKATRCALEMDEVLRKVNQEFLPECGPYLLRIGVYSGAIFGGPVGNRERLSYDFLGSTINKAARLEALEKELLPPTAENPVRIFVSHPTKKKLSESNIPIASAGKFQVDKRVESPEEVWHIATHHPSSPQT